MVSRKRHIAKAISYRIFSTAIGFFLVLTLTGNLKISGAFGVAELLYKPLQFYIHERIWYRWVTYGLGRKKAQNNTGEKHNFD